jgi:hypothetical protein
MLLRLSLFRQDDFLKGLEQACLLLLVLLNLDFQLLNLLFLLVSMKRPLLHFEFELGVFL